LSEEIVLANFIEGHDGYFYKKKHFSKGKNWIRGKDNNFYNVKQGKWIYNRYGNFKKMTIGKSVIVKKGRELIFGDAVNKTERKPEKIQMIKLKKKKKDQKKRLVLMVENEKKEEKKKLTTQSFKIIEEYDRIENESINRVIDEDNKGWNSSIDEISVEIKKNLFQDKDEIERFFPHFGEDIAPFLQLIRKVFLILKNKTNLLNDLSVNQLKKIPPKIYNIAKDICSFQDFIREEKKFLKKIRNLYGFIYLATNHATENKKVYVGQTKKTIEKEWGDILYSGRRLRRKREKNPNEKIRARYIENAIAKYGGDAWDLKLIDIAYSKSELNKKETYYIVEEYDSMNPEKGYNLTSGGEEGMEFSPEILDYLKDIAVKWYSDPENKEMHKKIMEKITQNPEYRKKMSEIMTNVAKRPEIREKRREITKKLFEENPEYREKIDEARRKNWEDPEFQEKQRKSHTKEIYDLKGFLTDIINETKKDMEEKYKVSRQTISDKIAKILEPLGIKGFLEAKAYLKDKDLDKIIEQIDPKWHNGF